MHFGLVLECDYREGATQEEAFQEAFNQVDAAEAFGLDGVWLAERHFATPTGQDETRGVGIPSIASAPLVLASAMAARTSRLRIGIAVNVLPLCHPIRMAEEAATVDQISRGRFEFGVGRSGFASAYESYGIPYSESRERFRECLDIIVKAWTNDRFSHQGEHYSFSDVCVVPKPYQKPYPPIRIAATTKETFPQVGRMGYPIFIGLRGMDLPGVIDALKVYRESWRQAGHPGNGDVILRIPIYVAETRGKALSEPQESTMRAYQRQAKAFASSAEASGSTVTEERAERAQRLSSITYEELLRDRLAYGTPEDVVDRLGEIHEKLELSGIIAEMNTGSLIPLERILASLRLFCDRVLPRFK